MSRSAVDRDTGASHPGQIGTVPTRSGRLDSLYMLSFSFITPRCFVLLWNINSIKIYINVQKFHEKTLCVLFSHQK